MSTPTLEEKRASYKAEENHRRRNEKITKILRRYESFLHQNWEKIDRMALSHLMSSPLPDPSKEIRCRLVSPPPSFKKLSTSCSSVEDSESLLETFSSSMDSIKNKYGIKPIDKLKLIILEGCHGVGKTYIVKKLEEQGHRVLIENFEDYLTKSRETNPQIHIKAQLYVAQMDYVSHMIRVIRKAHEDKCKALILDRFFLTTILYSLTLATYKFADEKDEHFDSELFTKTLVPMIRDLTKYCEFSYFIIGVATLDNYDKLQKRIEERLLTQPWRKDLFEHEKKWTMMIDLNYKMLSHMILTLLHEENPKVRIKRLGMDDENYMFLIQECKQYL